MEARIQLSTPLKMSCLGPNAGILKDLRRKGSLLLPLEPGITERVGSGYLLVKLMSAVCWHEAGMA